MKYTYRINMFQDDGGEQMSAIYCANLGELAIETRGDIVCTEQDALEDVLSGTPWTGEADTLFAEGWQEMTSSGYNALNSAGLREWIDEKEAPEGWR